MTFPNIDNALRNLHGERWRGNVLEILTKGDMMKTGKRRGPVVTATAGEIQKIMRKGGRELNPKDPNDAEALTALRRMEVVNARNGALSPNSLRRLAK